MIDILLVDDYAAVRDGLRMRLSLEPDLRIVGEAKDGLNAILLARNLNPSLIIMDVEMPKLDGISAAAQMKSEAVDSEIIILSMDDSTKTHEKAKAAGAAAVLPKNDPVELLISTIRSVASSRSPAMAVA
jgi:DNA-binding NarL/FixJ family response regulator